MALVEYLYIDKNRLDSYFEQISTPVTYDKVPTWHGEMSLTGPKAGGKQERFARAYNVHEKISKLVEHLEDEELVDGYSTAFQTHEGRAKRVLVPPRPGAPYDGGLAVWIALDVGQRYRKNLYLLEDSGRNADISSGFYVTAYSTLIDIVRHAAAFSEGKSLTAFQDEGWLMRKPTEQEASIRRLFLHDPTAALTQLGAHVGPERNIRTLYRVRAQGFEDEDISGYYREIVAPKTDATFGYPIFIVEATPTSENFPSTHSGE